MSKNKMLKMRDHIFCDSWTDVNVGTEACDPSGNQEL